MVSITGKCRGMIFCCLIILALFLQNCASVSTTKNDMDFGDWCLKRGLWKEAILRYERVIKYDATNVRALNNLGIAYEASGEFEKAGNAYKEALRIDPDNKSVMKNLDALLSNRPYFTNDNDDEQTD